MLFLLLAIATSAGNSLTMKFAGARSDNRYTLLMVNYVTTVLLGGAFIAGSGVPLLQTPPLAIGLGAINGIIYVLAFVLLQLNVGRNGATLTSSVSNMGAIIPIVVAVAIFGETPTMPQVAGLVVALVALAVISVPPRDRKAPALDRTAQAPAPAPTNTGITPGGLARLLLVPLVIGNGLGSTMSKVYEQTCDADFQLVFIFITFLVAMLVSFLLVARAGERPNRVDVACGIVLGTFNYFSSELLLRAVIELPAYLAYTGFSLGVIAVINIVNATVLRELLSRKDYLAMGLIAVTFTLLYLPV